MVKNKSLVIKSKKMTAKQALDFICNDWCMNPDNTSIEKMAQILEACITNCETNNTDSKPYWFLASSLGLDLFQTEKESY
jgi:hypothetical protein